MNKQYLIGGIAGAAAVVLFACVMSAFGPFRNAGHWNDRYGMMNRGGMMGGYANRSNSDDRGGSMGRMMGDMSAGMMGKTGDEFDKAFLSEMIVHHQGAVMMSNMVLKTSKRPELIKLASDIITAQEAEIKLMQGWQASWFPVTK